jgi:hypothetical protein
VKNYSARLPREHVTTVSGTPVTTIARTAIDLARRLPFTDAVVVADAAVRWRLGGRPRLRAVIDRLLREQGFKIVHITSAELDQHPGRIIDRIRTAFTSTSAY